MKTAKLEQLETARKKLLTKLERVNKLIFKLQSKKIKRNENN